ncbi:MAG: 4Fe-4S dicluster domain-containing protein [Candidatus Omnitrophota bacterium]|jgi:Fe-S oxidoreductase|nr:MAG: 4Fe-4S dicluster domain-containing protein [Candidatus Omnitrophota bacterium]
MFVGQFIFAVLFIAALIFFAFNFYRLLALLCLGRWENRFDFLLTRLKNMFVYAFGQLRVIERPYGVNHLLIFWGFLTLLALNAEFLISGIFPAFSLSFIGRIPYGLLLTATEIMSLIVLISVLIAVIRRLFFRPAYIELSADAFIILFMIAALMVAYFGYHAGEIHLGKTDWAGWMPVSGMVANLFSSVSTEPTVQTVTHLCWWIHALVLLAFLNYLPYSKHLHVITAIPNCFFRSFDYAKTVPRLIFQRGNEFGISRITQFTWKNLLDFMSCTECGRCQDGCPANHTGKTLNPRDLIHRGKLNLFTNGRSILAGRPLDSLLPTPADAEMNSPLIGNGENSISEADLWHCTTCGACMTNCPVFIEHVPKIIEMRRHLVMEQSKFPEELTNFFMNSEQRFNPWGLAPTDRAKWAQDLPVPFVEEGKPVEYLFFVGCSGAYDSRSKNVVTSVAKIFNHAGLSWGILGNEEKCCGDSLRRLGNEYVFEQLARDNIATFRKYGITKIVTHCPHGYSTLKNDYAQFGGEFEVLHHSQLIDQLIREGKLTLSKKSNGTTVFHDSCYLARYNEITEAPRNVLKGTQSGSGFVEMPRHGQNGFCCGAGGGRMWLEELEGKRINTERTEEALATGANTIAVACPFCMTMFEDGLKDLDVVDQVHVKDIAELVAESME